MRRAKRALRILACWLAVMGAVVAVVCIYGQLRFGSPRAPFILFSGDALLVTPTSIDVGEMKVRESRDVRLHLCNLTSRSVTVAGFRTTCTCMSASRLPLTLPPRGRADITLAIIAKARPERQHAIATLYVSEQLTRQISVPVALRVDTATVPRNEDKTKSATKEIYPRPIAETASAVN